MPTSISTPQTLSFSFSAGNHQQEQQQQQQQRRNHNQDMMTTTTMTQQQQPRRQQQEPPPPWSGYNRRTDCSAYPSKCYTSMLFEQQSIARRASTGGLGSSLPSSSSFHHPQHPTTSAQQTLKPMDFDDVWNSCDDALEHHRGRGDGNKNFNKVFLGRRGEQQQYHHQTKKQQQQQSYHPTRKDFFSPRNCDMLVDGSCGGVNGARPSSKTHSCTPITLQDLSISSSMMMLMLPFSKQQQPHHHSSPPPPPNNYIDEREGTEPTTNTTTTTTTAEVVFYGSLAAARAHAIQRRPSKEQHQHPILVGGVVLPPKGGVGGVRRKVQSVSAMEQQQHHHHHHNYHINGETMPSSRPLREDDADCSNTNTAGRRMTTTMTASAYPSNDGQRGETSITIVNADVQGWTSFWEVCTSDAMQKAVSIYDGIMRKCYTESCGYEIKATGGIFHIAFPQPVDALLFALQAQLKLYAADWPKGITMHEDGKVEPALKFNGFRVKFAVHHGPAIRRVHAATGRTIYSGEVVEIAKAVESMCHGGQILTTIETWNAVCDNCMTERYLGSPQVIDCGEHFLFKTNTNDHLQPGGGTHNLHGSASTKKCTRRIMQLVPNELAFDFFEARGRRDVPPSSADGQIGYEIKNSCLVNGRLFPPLNSKRQLTTCFLNAPYANGRVTICFVHTIGLDEEYCDPTNQATNLGILAKHIRKQLLLIDPPGYECREDDGCWMIAFDTMAHAVTFGLASNSTIDDNVVAKTWNNANRKFKVGIVSGPFTSMGPHKTTGKADYFGPIVNRAMQVASNCIPGEVVVGIPLCDGATVDDSPDFGPTINVKLQGIKKLVGIALDMAIFACSQSRIENMQ